MLTITVERDTIGPYVEQMASRAADWSAPNMRVLQSGIEEARATIQSGGSGAGWAPISPFTLLIDDVLGRTREGQLQETGAMAASLGDVLEVGPTEGIAGTSSDVALYQHGGTTRTFSLLKYLRSGGAKREYGGRGIPPRPFMFWHTEKLPEYDDIFMAHLMGEGEGNA